MGDRVLTEIPEALGKLVKYIMCSFYKTEEALLMDYLMAHPCIREDDLEKLIKFDRKMLRQHLNVLKQEFFIEFHRCVETDANGRATYHNYYYIAYNTFINVVGDKLYKRQKIEADERQYVCPNCKKTYTELDVCELMTPTGELHCSYCQTEVIEEKLEMQTAGANSMIVKSHEEFELIEKLLQELEGINLSPEILKPQPKEPKAAKSSNGGGSRAAGGERWFSSASRNREFNYVNEVTIEMEGEAGAVAGATKTKEAPVLMKESTVGGAQPNIECLSTEILERILVNAVVEELKDLNLGKASWKEIARRLKKVSFIWKTTLGTSHFQFEVENKLQGLVLSASLGDCREIDISAGGVKNCNILQTASKIVIMREHSVEFVNLISRLWYRLVVFSATPTGDYDLTTNDIQVNFKVVGMFHLEGTVYFGESEGNIYQLNGHQSKGPLWMTLPGLKRLSVTNNNDILCLVKLLNGCLELSNHNRLNFGVV